MIIIAVAHKIQVKCIICTHLFRSSEEGSVGALLQKYEDRHDKSAEYSETRADRGA